MEPAVPGWMETSKGLQICQHCMTDTLLDAAMTVTLRYLAAAGSLPPQALFTRSKESHKKARIRRGK